MQYYAHDKFLLLNEEIHTVEAQWGLVRLQELGTSVTQSGKVPQGW